MKKFALGFVTTFFALIILPSAFAAEEGTSCDDRKGIARSVCRAEQGFEEKEGREVQCNGNKTTTTYKNPGSKRTEELICSYKASKNRPEEKDKRLTHQFDRAKVTNRSRIRGQENRLRAWERGQSAKKRAQALEGIRTPQLRDESIESRRARRSRVSTEKVNRRGRGKGSRVRSRQQALTEVKTAIQARPGLRRRIQGLPAAEKDALRITIWSCLGLPNRNEIVACVKVELGPLLEE